MQNAFLSFSFYIARSILNTCVFQSISKTAYQSDCIRYYSVYNSIAHNLIIMNFNNILLNIKTN